MWLESCMLCFVYSADFVAAYVASSLHCNLDNLVLLNLIPGTCVCVHTAGIETPQSELFILAVLKETKIKFTLRNT